MKYRHTAIVCGATKFPLHLLGLDRCHAATVHDSKLIEQSIRSSTRTMTAVRLVSYTDSMTDRCITVEAWAGAGWQCVWEHHSYSNA